MTVTDSSLEVVFQGNHRMAHELLHEDETLRTLQQIVRTALGRDLEVRLIDAPTANGDESRAITNSTSPEENLFSLTRAPIVRDTIDLFGGRILDVRQRTVSREIKDRPMSEDEMVSQEDMVMMNKGFGNIMKQAQKMQEKLVELQEGLGRKRWKPLSVVAW